MPTRRSLTLLSPAQCRHAAWVAVTTAAFSLLAAGCGGGGHGDGGTTAAVDSVAEAAQARTQLSTLLAGTTPDATGLGAIDAAQLAAVRARFALAYGANQRNTEAAFGLAVTDLAVNAQALVAAEDASAGKSRHVSLRRSAAASVTKSTLRDALLRPLLLGSGKDLHSLTGTRAASLLVALPLLRTRQAGAGGASLTASFRNLLAALNRDLPLLALAANDPQFSFPLTGVGGTGITTTVDEADARAFEAGAFGARAAVDAALAYDLDPQSFDLTTAVSQTISANGGGTITPGQYLPPAPFGQLQSDGKSLLASAKSDLGLVVSTVQNDVPLLQARSDAATHLFPSASLTASDYSSLQLELAAAQYALNHSVTTGGITYNLGAWLANPPASLTLLEPTYHSVGGQYVASAADYPDKTFGGLISGLPDSAYAAHVDADGTYGDLAAEGLATPLQAIVPSDL